MPRSWIYADCVIVRVHDGDTVIVDIDLGQDLWVKDRAVRLAGIACRELGDPGGPEAAAYVHGLCPPGTLVRVESRGWDKYAGRILGVVYLPDTRSLQALLIRDGWAVPWNGRGTQPKPAWPVQPVPGPTPRL